MARTNADLVKTIEILKDKLETMYKADFKSSVQFHIMVNRVWFIRQLTMLGDLRDKSMKSVEEITKTINKNIEKIGELQGKIRAKSLESSVVNFAEGTDTIDGVLADVTAAIGIIDGHKKEIKKILDHNVVLFDELKGHSEHAAKLKEEITELEQMMNTEKSAKVILDKQLKELSEL